MTTGASGTYAFAGVDLTLQPTVGRWMGRADYGIDGGGHPVYSQYRDFEMEWNLVSPSEAQQIIGIYNTVSNTGTVVSCLPEYGAADYQFKNYSGTTLKEPEFGDYFNGYISSVKLLIINAKT